MGNVAGKDRNMVIFLSTGEESNFKWFSDFFQRPVIYFFFGLPLLAPSVMLIVLSSVDDGLDESFIVLASLLFLVSVLSLTVGTLLGLRNHRYLIKYKHREKLLASEKLRSPRSRLSNPASDRNLSPFTLSGPSTAPSTAPSSRRSSSNSSLSSTGGSSNNMNILSTADKSKLITLKKKSIRRKRGVKFPVDKLPSLIEEDTFVRSLSRGNSQANFPLELLPKSAGGTSRRAPVSATKGSLEELKDYLNVIGLGGEMTSTAPASTAGTSKRRRSFDERTLEMDGLNGVNKQEINKAQTSREWTANSVTSPRPNKPILVSASHERTGIRLPNVS